MYHCCICDISLSCGDICEPCAAWEVDFYSRPENNVCRECGGSPWSFPYEGRIVNTYHHIEGACSQWVDWAGLAEDYDPNDGQNYCPTTTSWSEKEHNNVDHYS